MTLPKTSAESRASLRASFPSRTKKMPETASPGTAAKPFSIRLTDNEKQVLLQHAGPMPLGAYIRKLILTETSRAPRRKSRRAPAPVKDHEALGRVLAALGQSRIANNLNQLAKAVNIGMFPTTPETEEDIVEACAAVAAMRRDLMCALGLRGEQRS